MSAVIRVLLVDDTAVVKRILSQILEEEPDIVVAGTASNGLEALQKLPRLSPDLIILDVEMPGMGGLDMLRELRKSGSTIPVLLFSSITERGAMVTVEALLLGANDYVTKPTMLGSIAAAREHIRSHLLPRVRALLKGQRLPLSVPLEAASPAVPSPRRPILNVAAGLVDAVVIAVSTGGPNALGDLIPALPEDFPVPVFIVQHMPAFFTRALAQRLDREAALSVAECDRPREASEAQVWLAAGGYHMVLAREGAAVQLRPDLSEPENFCRPSADVLFRSAVQVYGSRVLGVVMTGMGQDGGLGSRAIREAGGHVIVQDEASSVVWGMPGYVCQEGLANKVLPLNDLAHEIQQRVAYGRPWFKPLAERKAEGMLS